ncbi:MAG: hypothetical protein ACT4QC_14715 [Planctomycetaceae bacterium]
MLSIALLATASAVRGEEPRRQDQAAPAPAARPERTFRRLAADGAIVLPQTTLPLDDPQALAVGSVHTRFWQAEVRFVRRVSGCSDDQLEKILRMAENEAMAAHRELVKSLKAARRGDAGHANEPPPDPRRLIQNALAAAVREQLSAEAHARYVEEGERRNRFDRQAAILAIVARVDQELMLSRDQRQRLTEVLEERWHDLTRPVRQDSTDRIRILEPYVAAHLSDVQKEACQIRAVLAGALAQTVGAAGRRPPTLPFVMVDDFALAGGAQQVREIAARDEPAVEARARKEALVQRVRVAQDAQDVRRVVQVQVENGQVVRRLGGENLAAGNIERLVFGAGQAADGGEQLDLQLRVLVDLAARECGLSDSQKAKLKLAGRGDIERFFDCVDEAQTKAQTALEGGQVRNEAWAQVSQEVQRLQRQLHDGLFKGQSLFAKTLAKVLSSEQAEAHARAQNERRLFRRTAFVEPVVALLGDALALADEQRRNLVRLLLDELPASIETSRPESATYMVAFEMTRLPEQKLRPLFDDAQWNNLKQNFPQFQSWGRLAEGNGQLPGIERMAVDAQGNGVLQLNDGRVLRLTRPPAPARDQNANK